MKSATLHQIKKELEKQAPAKLLELFVKLIKHKTENKELISYLLFDEDQLADYIYDLKGDISEMLGDMLRLPPYQAKRTLRKTLRFITRYSKYTGAKETEVELLIYVCQWLLDHQLHKHHSKVIPSIYFKQLEKIEKLSSTVHEDLKHDYLNTVKALRGF
ncbi:MAG: hypothetical protein WAU01_02015 [Saprospiraceae bacterium]